MHLIRAGLEKGIDASIYLDAGFTEGQLSEILDGAAEGFDVSIYANPKYNRELMFIARRGLEQGINDLPKYFDKGYNYDQIMSIYCGKKDGIDTSFYENPELDHIQMNIIRWGVKYGVDVTKFNNPEMSADEMEEIRNELIKEKEIEIWKKEGFDITPYIGKQEAGNTKDYTDLIEKLKEALNPSKEEIRKAYWGPKETSDYYLYAQYEIQASTAITEEKINNIIEDLERKQGIDK